MRDFHDDAGYVDAIAARAREYWSKHGDPGVVVLSFHGVPKRSVQRGDPYAQECATTARRLAAALGLAESDYRLTFH